MSKEMMNEFDTLDRKLLLLSKVRKNGTDKLIGNIINSCFLLKCAFAVYSIIVKQYIYNLSSNKKAKN